MGDTIRIKKESLWKYSTFVLAAILIIGAIVFFTSGDTTGRVVDDSGNALPSTGGNVQVSIDDDATRGDEDAKVTIVEFSDYECPFCGRYFQQTYGQLKTDYIDTGKVRYVFRDFPLSFHQNAMPAALAAECIKEKGGDEAYWKMHDKMFENQESLGKDNLKAWAKEIGYDISSCMDSEKYKSEIQKDMRDGQEYGVQGTPAFFINGKLISGAQPYSVFKQAIDAELAK